MPAPTVASLCRSLGTALRPAPGFTAPDTAIAAVHISELLDPTDYLSGGELLLTTGLALPANKIGCTRYVSRLVSVGVAALAFGLGPAHTAVPPHLEAACRAQGLTLLVVPPPTPFLTITKAYWQAVGRSSEQHLHDALAAQRAIVDAAASPDPVARVLRTLSRSLQAWTATYSPRAAPEQVHPAKAKADAAAASADIARLEGAGVHSSASFSTRSSSVMVVPLAAEDRVTGYLAVGTAATLDQAQRRAVLTASAVLSLEAARSARVRAIADEGRRSVGLLVAQGYADAAAALAVALGVPAPPARARVLVAAGPDLDRVGGTVADWSPTALVVRDHAAVWALLPSGSRNRADLERRLTADITVAAGEAVALAEVPGELDRLLHLIDSLPRGTRVWGDPTPYSSERAAAAESGVLALAEPLRDAVIAHLRHRGQWESAARDLGVHRNTLRNRIARATASAPDAVGLSPEYLEDPDLAAELWLTLRRHGHA